MTVFRTALALGISALFATASRAEQSTLQQVDNQAHPWRAVGKVNIAGYRRRGSCSGTLIGPARVVTAAHCFFRQNTGKRVRDDQVHFLAGLKGGNFVAHGRAKCVRLYPGYQFPGKIAVNSGLPDLAVIVLKEQMNLTPLPVTPPVQVVRKGQIYKQAGYARNRPSLLAVHNNCKVTRATEKYVLSTCSSIYGQSGGPLLLAAGADTQITGVVSARSRRGGTRVIPLSVWPGLLEVTCEPS